MDKIRLATIITVVAVVLVLAIVFSSEFYNTQTSNPQTPTPTLKPITDVHISDFHFTNFFPAEGLSWNAGFVIAVTNNETVSVENLTLTFVSESPYNMTRTVGFYNNTYPSNQRYVEMGQPCLLGPLEQGETKVFYGYIQDNMDDYYKIRGYTFVATLRIGNTVFDQATVNIPAQDTQPSPTVFHKPSTLKVISPINNSTYSSNTVAVIYSIDSIVKWSYYKIDDYSNPAGIGDFTSFKGNITLTLPEGQHRIALAVQTEDSRFNSPPIYYQTIDFTIDT
jgi:hypothetical protein